MWVGDNQLSTEVLMLKSLWHVRELWQRDKVLTCAQPKKSPIESSFSSPRAGTNLGMRSSCIILLWFLDYFLLGHVNFSIGIKGIKAILETKGMQLTTNKPFSDIPVILSLQPQKWPLSQQTDPCWSETWPLSNTAKEIISLSLQMSSNKLNKIVTDT